MNHLVIVQHIFTCVWKICWHCYLDLKQGSKIGHKIHYGLWRRVYGFEWKDLSGLCYSIKSSWKSPLGLLLKVTNLLIPWGLESMVADQYFLYTIIVSFHLLQDGLKISTLWTEKINGIHLWFREHWIGDVCPFGKHIQRKLCKHFLRGILGNYWVNLWSNRFLLNYT